MSSLARVLHAWFVLTPLAVSALPRSRAGTPLQAASLPAAVLLLTLIAPALDLLSMVQPDLALANTGLMAAAVASTALLGMWVRFPRTSWLAAASLAGCASLASRLVGAELAPALSLLAVIALGIGGGFASSAADDETWLA